MLACSLAEQHHRVDLDALGQPLQPLERQVALAAPGTTTSTDRTHMQPPARFARRWRPNTPRSHPTLQPDNTHRLSQQVDPRAGRVRRHRGHDHESDLVRSPAKAVRRLTVRTAMTETTGAVRMLYAWMKLN